MPSLFVLSKPWTEGVDLPRVRKTGDILDAYTWKLIFVQATFQLIVMIVLMFGYGAMAYGKEAPNLFSTPLRNKDRSATRRLQMDTFIFHTFVLMCIFNLLNCRNVNPNDLNPLTNIINHFGFIFIFAIEIAAQQYMVM